VATVVDDSLNTATINRTLVDFNEAAARRVRFADADSEKRLIEMNTLMLKMLTGYDIFERLVMNQVTSDQTGGDDKLSERILNARSAQFQPQEATYVDPNFRGGASAPPGTKAQ